MMSNMDYMLVIKKQQMDDKLVHRPEAFIKLLKIQPFTNSNKVSDI